MKMIKMIKNNKMIFLVAIIYISLLAAAPDKALKSLNNSMYYLVEMLQILPVIFLLTVVIEVLVPKEAIIQKFGENSGIKGNLLSLLLGSISAGPIYAAFPIGKTLLKKGASITNIVIILSSWAVVKIPMLANEVKFLGFKFMAVRWVLTVISIFVMAYLVMGIVKRKDMPKEEEASEAETLKIKQEYCVGCGICAKKFPEHFGINGNKAFVKRIPQGEEEAAKAAESVEKCPAHAIAFKPVVQSPKIC